jgi:hypothetical protein
VAGRSLLTFSLVALSSVSHLLPTRTVRNSRSQVIEHRYCDFAMTTTYQYKTLEDPDNEIRLAMIQPGAFDDDIRISFILRKIEVCS